MVIDAGLFVGANEQRPKRLPAALGGVEVMVRLMCPVPRETVHKAGAHHLRSDPMTCADLIQRLDQGAAPHPLPPRHGPVGVPENDTHLAPRPILHD